AAAATASSAVAGVTNWAAEGMTLGHDVLAGLSHAQPLGAAPGDTMMTVAVGLAQPNPAAEQSYIAAEYNPSSPTYHQFLSPAAFDEMFGVPAATVSSTENWLESGGLKIGYVSPAGDMVQARGTSAQIASLMHTSFGQYRAGTIGFIANQVAPTIPKALPITVVSGLNTLQRVWTPGQVSAADGQKVYGTAPGQGEKTVQSASGTSVVGTVLPQDAWGVYDAPKSDTGQGEISGMFGAGYVSGVISVLRVYEQRTGLPQVPVHQVMESTFSPNATPNDGDVLGDAEWDLDNEAISSMAPGLTQLDQYFASTEFDADMGVIFDDWANDPNGPKQMNASFGECETVPVLPTAVNTTFDNSTNWGEGIAGEDFQMLADPSLEQAVAEGRTLFAAAGDTGGSCPAVVIPILGAGNGVNPQPAANDNGYPCVSVYATCVGGTVVTTNGTTDPKLAGDPQSDYTANVKRVNEQAWAFTGGGPAAFVPEPAWQKSVAAVNEPCTGPEDENGNVITPGTTCRGVPDIAAMSGSSITDSLVAGNNGYYLSMDDMPISTGGTSLASPLTVGMWSRIEAGAPKITECVEANAQYKCTKTATTYGLGFADEAIYKAAESSNYSKDFYDITSADLPTGNFYHQAAAGWDYTSGWGALDVGQFIKNVDNNPNMVPTHALAGTVVPPVSLNCSSGTITSQKGRALDYTITPPVGSFTNDGALDMTWSSMTVKGKNLQVVIGGPALSTQGPPDNIDGYNFYGTWAYNGVTYTAFAAVDDPTPLPATQVTNSIGAPVSPPTGQVTYGDGLLNGFGPSSIHIDTGSFTQTGTAGYFTINVPLANVGSPGPGAKLQYPFFWDTLPNGVLVPTATSELAADAPGQQVVIKGC
ncbi:MAG: S53 family peptidase, partial [Acidimicrobiales bacterium]